MKHPATLGLSLLLLLAGASIPPQEADTKAIFDQIAKAPVDQVWNAVPKLEKLGRTALPELRTALADERPAVRLASAIVLYKAEIRDAALDGFRELIVKAPAEVRRAAAHASGILVARDLERNPERKQAFEKFLRAQAQESAKGDDRHLEIALWLAYWRQTNSLDSRRTIKGRIFDVTTDPEIKDEAALSLGEMHAFSDEMVRHLRSMSVYPTERGKLALAHLDYYDMRNLLERAEQRGIGDEPPSEYPKEFALLNEVVKKLKENHVTPDKIDIKKLVTNAARGMCADIDPYTAYYDEEMIRELMEDLEGDYGGIGARVAMKRDRAGNSWLTIVEPIFSGPAYSAGIRSGDMIVSIEGESTVNRDLQVLVKRLRGLENTPVKFKVYSRRWRENKDFEIVRKQIQIETTPYQLLPGQIGYINLTTFGPQNTDEVKEAVRDLTGKGMKSLVLDLRGNSGGYLNTAHQIAGLFLNKGQVIVVSKGRDGKVEEEYRAKNDPLTKVPMTVLVDELSASASEILAGALQAHKRAVLVGQKTFGKGSVQKLKNLETSKGAVRVTVARWYLEGDVSVEKEDPTKNGVMPDIEVKAADDELWLVAEADRVAREGGVDKYLSERMEKHRALFEELAEFDGADASRYPDFDAFYGALKTKADKGQVCRIVRAEMRHKVADLRGKAFVCDYQYDRVLQRGIANACKQAGIDHTTVKEYKGIDVKEPVVNTDKPID